MPLEQLISDPRVTVRRAASPDCEGRCVVYWMQRAQRGIDNLALNVAVEAANLLRRPVVVFLAPVPFYPNANLRHYAFLNEGIPDIAEDLVRRNIGFILRRYPDHSLIKFCDEVAPCLVIGDENPMGEPERWRQLAAKKLRIPFWTVDADVVVPSNLLEKAQYAARIIRPRLQRQLERFLVEPGNPRARVPWEKPNGCQSLPIHANISDGWESPRAVAPVSGFVGGTKRALKTLREFVSGRLKGYSEQRSHPENSGTSHLSAYLHFGHIGPHTVALAVKKADAPRADKEAFLDQLITWRELAINFVRFNPNYDSFESGEQWAERTLAEHARDHRPVIYTEKQLENAETHDPLWNAGQMQMVNQGWMHNYVRMYWAKKILEWSPSAAEAYRIAVWLNDKYEMDGRDPNGYAGIAWAIVGKFDRPWFERPIFGTIRYMSLGSTGKKFDSRRYIEQQLSSKVLG
ncbi:MAG TPA: deoxyribodipyrimidine photo-lyase [Terriglobales bacterium]